MAEHDPADVEFMARLHCAMMQIDPNELLHDGQRFWQRFEPEAIRALDYLQAREAKVIARNPKTFDLYSPGGVAARKAHQLMHDAAPLTPRD